MMYSTLITRDGTGVVYDIFYRYPEKAALDTALQGLKDSYTGGNTNMTAALRLMREKV